MSITIHNANEESRDINDTGPINKKAVMFRDPPRMTTTFPLICLSHKYPQHKDEMANGPP